MLIAPIIHTRTLYSDFLSGFLVRPDYFTSKDIDWARRLIRASTADIDLMKGERYVVLDNGKIRIAGIVILNAELANKSVHKIDKRFFYDEQGRNIYAFIGICTTVPLQYSITLTYDVFADIFEKYVIPVFDNKTVETTSVNNCILAEKSVPPDKPEDNGISLNQSMIYEAAFERDKQWFDYFLCCKEKGFSFCSNVNKYQTLKESVFNFITTTPNNIKRLKMDMPDIDRAAKEQEENDYKQFKEKYYKRLIEELRPEICKELSQDSTFIDSILKAQSSLIRDKVYADLFLGVTPETEHYKIIKLGKKLNSVPGQGKKQTPVSIVKKE